ncbi:hypothetical protein [Ilumatobacter nonamiensis]|uniref:hypothetical protein n=1 Tax=Ilumatobacter nonamiensis TaxID=467093 RepID=UPI000347C3EA|nr:hypothetical protein [Ilumatobacter nonamiensis]
MTDTHGFQHGDRIRYATQDEDGFPLVRYGFVGGVTDDNGPVVIMLDGELGGDVVDLDKIEPVHICNVTLKLDGRDLLDDLTLRSGLVSLWEAEAEDAGLQIGAIHPIVGRGRSDDGDDGCELAELTAAGDQYLLRAVRCKSEDAILIHCTRPHPWTL